MADTWFCSDLHFFHKGVLRFCPETRPWADIYEMNEALVAAWNANVKRNDTVYHLGDFSFGKREETEAILQRLNGRKYFIFGNHDDALRGAWAQRYLEHSGDLFYHKINGVDVFMTHYPTYEWRNCQHGSYALHGHTHGKLLTGMAGKFLDCGWDAHGKILHWDVVHAILKDRPIVEHHFGTGGTNG